MVRLPFLLMFASMGAMALSGCAALEEAEEITETLQEAIAAEEYVYQEWEVVDGGTEVEISLAVTDGPRVNFYVIEPSQLSAYEQGRPFQVVDGQRVTQATHYHDVILFPRPGIYYMLFDNYLDDVTPADSTSYVEYTLSYVPA